MYCLYILTEPNDRLILQPILLYVKGLVNTCPGPGDASSKDIDDIFGLGFPEIKIHIR